MFLGAESILQTLLDPQLIETGKTLAEEKKILTLKIYVITS
jgi:hypothetical protein